MVGYDCMYCEGLGYEDVTVIRRGGIKTTKEECRVCFGAGSMTNGRPDNGVDVGITDPDFFKMEGLLMNELDENFILKNWEEEWEEGRYFMHLKNGDSIGYDYNSEQFSLNNYWNERPYGEVKSLIDKYGMED